MLVGAFHSDGPQRQGKAAVGGNNNLHLAVTEHVHMGRLMIIGMDREAQAMLAMNRWHDLT